MSAAAGQEDGEEARLQKESNLQRYSERAVRGLPLFSEQSETGQLAQG